MNRLRRMLLELWAMLVLTAVVGFLGPFGTFLRGDFLFRIGIWWMMLVGAYLLIRPIIVLLHMLARSTRLPQGMLVFSGVILGSFPLAVGWQAASPEATRNLIDFAGLLPFALLCALGILAVSWWAERADAHLTRYYREGGLAVSERPLDAPLQSLPGETGTATTSSRLHSLLGRQFAGPVLALESEDHYVRIHGTAQSELLLMRLRDAIEAMEGCPGEQVHRSWWVARSAVAGVASDGRRKEIRLTNGTLVPVARDSIDRLQRSGFLPAG